MQEGSIRVEQSILVNVIFSRGKASPALLLCFLVCLASADPSRGIFNLSVFDSRLGLVSRTSLHVYLAQVFLSSAAPPVRFPNVYGIDIPTKSELVAHNRTPEQVCELAFISGGNAGTRGCLESDTTSCTAFARSLLAVQAAQNSLARILMV